MTIIKKWRKMRTMDKILLLVGVFLLIFTTAMVVVFLVVGAEPATLITCVFAACTAEGGFMSLIKATKVKKTPDIKSSPGIDPGEGEGQ